MGILLIISNCIIHPTDMVNKVTITDMTISLPTVILTVVTDTKNLHTADIRKNLNTGIRKNLTITSLNTKNTNPSLMVISPSTRNTSQSLMVISQNTTVISPSLMVIGQSMDTGTYQNMVTNLNTKNPSMRKRMNIRNPKLKTPNLMDGKNKEYSTIIQKLLIFLL